MRPLFRSVNISQRALDYHLERHNVLAGNVANVDTPRFQPQDLVRAADGGADHGEPHARLRRTDPRHLGGTSQSDTPYEVRVAEDRVVNPGKDGNAVSLEREMAKVAANQLRYEGAIRIVRHQLGMLRYAANDGG